MKIGNKNFDVENNVYIMGILNVTPDSFSDGGEFNHIDKALKRVEEMILEGVDIIDVGGESTRPGHIPISEQEEIHRVAPVIEKIHKHFDIPISVDSYKAKVAKAGILAGASLVNDIWGLKYDKEMARLIAEEEVTCCLMHNRDNTNYHNFMPDVLMDLEQIIESAKRAGIKQDKIILDPGVGFGKTYEQNLEIINHLDELCGLGYPFLLAASRKSVIGLTLELPVYERLEGTLVTTVMGVLKGCAFVRVHDIKENKRVIKMTKTIMER
ncbi:dihydropteroate synthase [Lachnotalea glycerini]|uniref:Dihydropteroate synthase n=1 Tax=Lachnotalea glycerini TaxID=1763509 RepID=A0A318ESV1_9FIRM|nr:dihydropteroate synthase [Lachnotalea glycerini]PXV95969.1 dihydropteroate synthase [Lachnotalea glycerini]